MKPQHPRRVSLLEKRTCCQVHVCEERTDHREHLGSQPDGSCCPWDLPAAFQVFSHKEQIFSLTKGLVTQEEITGQ